MKSTASSLTAGGGGGAAMLENRTSGGANGVAVDANADAGGGKFAPLHHGHRNDEFYGGGAEFAVSPSSSSFEGDEQDDDESDRSSYSSSSRTSEGGGGTEPLWDDGTPLVRDDEPAPTPASPPGVHPPAPVWDDRTPAIDGDEDDNDRDEGIDATRRGGDGEQPAVQWQVESPSSPESACSKTTTSSRPTTARGPPSPSSVGNRRRLLRSNSGARIERGESARSLLVDNFGGGSGGGDCCSSSSEEDEHDAWSVDEDGDGDSDEDLVAASAAAAGDASHSSAGDYSNSSARMLLAAAQRRAGATTMSAKSSDDEGGDGDGDEDLVAATSAMAAAAGDASHSSARMLLAAAQRRAGATTMSAKSSDDEGGDGDGDEDLVAATSATAVGDYSNSSARMTMLLAMAQRRAGATASMEDAAKSLSLEGNVSRRVAECSAIDPPVGSSSDEEEGHEEGRGGGGDDGGSHSSVEVARREKVRRRHLRQQKESGPNSSARMLLAMAQSRTSPKRVEAESAASETLAGTDVSSGEAVGRGRGQTFGSVGSSEDEREGSCDSSHDDGSDDGSGSSEETEEGRWQLQQQQQKDLGPNSSARMLLARAQQRTAPKHEVERETVASDDASTKSETKGRGEGRSWVSSGSGEEQQNLDGSFDDGSGDDSCSVDDDAYDAVESTEGGRRAHMQEQPKSPNSSARMLLAMAQDRVATKHPRSGRGAAAPNGTSPNRQENTNGMDPAHMDSNQGKRDGKPNKYVSDDDGGYDEEQSSDRSQEEDTSERRRSATELLQSSFGAGESSSEGEPLDSDGGGSAASDDVGNGKPRHLSTMEQMLSALPQDETRVIPNKESTEDALDAQSVRSYGAALLALAENSRASRMQKRFSTGQTHLVSQKTSAPAVVTPPSSGGGTGGAMTFEEHRHEERISEDRDGSSSEGDDDYSASSSSSSSAGRPPTPPSPSDMVRLVSPQLVHKVMRREAADAAEYAAATGAESFKFVTPDHRAPDHEEQQRQIQLQQQRQHQLLHRKDLTQEQKRKLLNKIAEGASTSSPPQTRQHGKLQQQQPHGSARSHGPSSNGSLANEGRPAVTRTKSQRSTRALPPTSRGGGHSVADDAGGNLMEGFGLSRGRQWLGTAKKWWEHRQEEQRNLEVERRMDLQNRMLARAKKDSERSLKGASHRRKGSGGSSAGAGTAKGGDGNFSVDVQIEPEPPSEFYNMRSVPYLLETEIMRELAEHHFPVSIKFSRWKRLYSLARDGDAFETFLERTKGKERTLLVVRSTKEDIFGGFVDSPWEATHSDISMSSSSFYGSAQAFLFKIVREATTGAATDAADDTAAVAQSQHQPKEKLVVFKWTGTNRYIQLCDGSAEMIAMGGGGESGSFGLCIEDDFSRGSSGNCETFENDPLTTREYFDVLDVEVWGFMSMY